MSCTCEGGMTCRECYRPPALVGHPIPESTAVRFDTGKARYDLIPHEWEEQIALVFTADAKEQLAFLLSAGAQKYTDRNWEKSAGTPASTEWRARCIASLRRHLAAWQRGEILDPEHAAKGFDIHHMTAVAWNALAIMWYDAREGKK